MPMFQWDEKFSVNVSVFDAQHKKLIGYVNDLYEAMKAGRGKDVMAELIERLVGYTETHFSDEEQKMKLYNYPAYENHRLEHESFVRRVQIFKRDYENNKVAVTIEIMHFLKDWVMNHIMKTDKKYTEFFNSKGLR